MIDYSHSLFISDYLQNQPAPEDHNVADSAPPPTSVHLPSASGDTMCEDGGSSDKENENYICSYCDNNYSVRAHDAIQAQIMIRPN